MVHRPNSKREAFGFLRTENKSKIILTKVFQNRRMLHNVKKNEKPSARIA